MSGSPAVQGALVQGRGTAIPHLGSCRREGGAWLWESTVTVPVTVWVHASHGTLVSPCLRFGTWEANKCWALPPFLGGKRRLTGVHLVQGPGRGRDGPGYSV